MKYRGKPLNPNEYFLYDTYSKSRGIYQYKRKEPINTKSRKNHNTLYLKICKWSNTIHIGEMLGYLIAQKMGFKACDIELYRQHRYKKFYDVGVISYVEQAEDDSLLCPDAFIKKYRELNNIKTAKPWLVDIDTIFGTIFSLCQQYHRPYQEYLSFKQAFINMVIFDLKLLNSDRTTGNWLLRRNTTSGEIDLYPMFDNASILGLEIEAIPSPQDANYSINLSIYDNQQISSITSSKNMQNSEGENYKTLLIYLLEKYPIETKKALKQAEKFTVNDLNELLNEIDTGLEEGETPVPIKPHIKKFILDLYLEREKGIKETISKFQENQIQKIEE